RPARPVGDRGGNRGSDSATRRARAGRVRAGARLQPGRRGAPHRRGLPGGCVVTAPLVVVDADVLGRQRTGDETYVENLLARLPSLAGGDLRFAALTRRPDLVPAGVEPVHVPARFQEARMLWTVPRALRR